MSKSKPTTKVSKKDATEGVKKGRVVKASADSGKNKSALKKSSKGDSGKSAKAVEQIKKAVESKVDSSSDDDSDISDSVASEDEAVAKKAATKGDSKSKKAKAPTDSEESSDDSSDSDAESSAASDSDEEASSSDDSSESESESEAPKPKGKAAKVTPVVNGKSAPKDKKAAPAADETSDSSASSASESENEAESGSDAKSDASDSEDGSDSSSDSESESEEKEVKAAPVNANKRKAIDEEATPAKKAKVETGEGSSLFIGNLSWNVDKEWVAREFEEFGTITGCRIITDKESGRSKGYGYVDFSTPEEARAAQEARHGYFLDGRDLRVDFATPRPERPQDSPAAFKDRANFRAQKFGDATSAPTKTLWVGNLPYGTDEDTIKAGFGEYGAISRVGLPRDRETNEIKGIAYVTYGEVEEAKAALEALNGTDFNGRALRLDFDKGRDDAEGGRGGFGGRGRGGFGDRGGRGGFGGGRGGFGDRGGRGGGRGFGDRGGRGGRGRGRGGPPNTTNRGGFGDFKGQKVSFDD